MSHTPGPWRWQESGTYENGDAGKLVAESGAVVLSGFGEGVSQAVEVGDADARLIAAAPQMLAVLKEVRKNTFFYGIPSGNATCSITPDALELLVALIARIEGEP